MNLNKKRKKRSRIRGRKTAGTGFMKKGRGKGHHGGIGMAGTGKRADHKKTMILKKGENYFGRDPLKAKEKKYEVINVGDIQEKFAGKKEIDLSNYKILGRGEINESVNVKAGKISNSAKEKIEGAGGKVKLVEEKVVEEKSE